jgi:hypothetical protein
MFPSFKIGRAIACHIEQPPGETGFQAYFWTATLSLQTGLANLTSRAWDRAVHPIDYHEAAWAICNHPG